MLPLEGKVAVVTGGSRGLGLAIARAYVQAGAAVMIASRSQRSVDQAIAALQAAGTRVAGQACDVADLPQVEALAAETVQRFGGMDIWVNNAGLSSPYGPTAHLPHREFMQVVDTNIIGTYHGSTVALRYFVRQGRGKLINLLGRGDREVVPFQNAYASSKVWVRHFTKALAAEYKAAGIGVYAFNPGLVKTDMLSQVHAVAGYEARLAPLSWVAGLWGNSAEVPAQKALWLASAATDGRTGLDVTVLTPLFMVSRVFQAGWNMLRGRRLETLALNVSTVPAALPVEKA